MHVFVCVFECRVRKNCLTSDMLVATGSKNKLIYLNQCFSAF